MSVFAHFENGQIPQNLVMRVLARYICHGVRSGIATSFCSIGGLSRHHGTFHTVRLSTAEQEAKHGFNLLIREGQNAFSETGDTWSFLCPRAGK